jgi:DNA-binding CsgD family transcriptional regulator
MSTPVRASDQDLRALAAIVSQDRPDLPAGEGLLPPSLLADLMAQICCDGISVEQYDTGLQVLTWLQGSDAGGEPEVPEDDDCGVTGDYNRVFWTHYWDCLICTHPVRTGDLRAVVKTSDFYSTRQWHSTGMYTDCIRPQGIEHHLMLALPELADAAAAPGRYLRMVLHRGPGPGFSERDRALLVLLRPHLYQAYLDAERRRHPIPRLTPRQNDLLRLLAAGHTNAQIARRLGISEGTVRTHLENIYEKLGVSSRTAAVTRAFPDRAA